MSEEVSRDIVSILISRLILLMLYYLNINTNINVNTCANIIQGPKQAIEFFSSSKFGSARDTRVGVLCQGDEGTRTSNFSMKVSSWLFRTKVLLLGRVPISSTCCAFSKP